MTIRVAIAAALASAVAAPAMAETVFDTHHELNMPAGKVPTKIYRPIARDACAVVTPMRQTGKLPIAPARVGGGEGCAVEFAQNNTTSRDAALRRD